MDSENNINCNDLIKCVEIRCGGDLWDVHHSKYIKMWNEFNIQKTKSNTNILVSDLNNSENSNNSCYKSYETKILVDISKNKK
jgi:hypothetical protein